MFFESNEIWLQKLGF